MLDIDSSPSWKFFGIVWKFKLFCWIWCRTQKSQHHLVFTGTRRRSSEKRHLLASPPERNFFNEIRRGWNRMRLTRHQAAAFSLNQNWWLEENPESSDDDFGENQDISGTLACNVYVGGGEILKTGRIIRNNKHPTSVQPTHCSKSIGNFRCTCFDNVDNVCRKNNGALFTLENRAPKY